MHSFNNLYILYSFSTNVLVFTILVSGGALLDIGGYPIQFVQMVYNHEKPKIVAAGFLQESRLNLNY